MATSSFSRKRNGDEMATSPYFVKGHGDGMVTFPFSLNNNDHGMVTSPFYLKEAEIDTFPVSLNGDGDMSPLHSL